MYLRAKFEVSSIILTSFRQWGGGDSNFIPPTLKQIPKKPTQIRVKELVKWNEEYHQTKMNKLWINIPKFTDKHLFILKIKYNRIDTSNLEG